ncbi:MAG: Guanine deaminase [Planctomycetes bacterium ADurb.Bin412]|nr:MAG: Guanine deaminase [Planctomycetes bacterium ADurb.Bin412]
MKLNPIHIPLPDWVSHILSEKEYFFPSVAERMNLVLELAAQNVKHATGGPFAAAVFDTRTGRLIAPGVNLVTSSNCSLAHAEMAALALAQQKLGCYNLSENNLSCQLVSSTAPCAMCLGAIPWSGISSLVCGARDEDARAIGFDEGDKPDHWIARLNQRGIEVIPDVQREKARSILQQYLDAGGCIYNG